MKIIQSILTKNPCYTTGKKITVKGLMLHSIGCPQPSAQVFVDRWNKPEHDNSCVHAFIDGNTGDVYQTLPWNHRGWHAGGKANDTHIGVEMCEPACIKYISGASFSCSDVATATAVAQRTYDTAVQLFAHLCKQYSLDPMGDGVIIGHAEGHARGVASNHADPEHIWKQLKMGYTMDTFRKAVKNAMGESKVTYKVQVGAYSKKSNAEAMLDKVKKAGFTDAYITTTTTTTSAPEKVEEPTLALLDRVKLSKDATVYGKTTRFSAWVYDSVLYVRQIDGDKIIISTLKEGAVTGTTHRKYLTKI